MMYRLVNKTLLYSSRFKPRLSDRPDWAEIWSKKQMDLEDRVGVASLGQVPASVQEALRPFFRVNNLLGGQNVRKSLWNSTVMVREP